MCTCIYYVWSVCRYMYMYIYINIYIYIYIHIWVCIYLSIYLSIYIYIYIYIYIRVSLSLAGRHIINLEDFYVVDFASMLYSQFSNYQTPSDVTFLLSAN